MEFRAQALATNRRSFELAKTSGKSLSKMQSNPTAPPAVTSGASQYVTRVQLNISCKNLMDKDVMSKSDPLAVVLLLNSDVSCL